MAEDNVKEPVRQIDQNTNYYGEQKFNGKKTLKPTVDKGFANMHGNLLNETNDHEDTQGSSNKVDRMKAMERRAGKVY